MMIAAVVTAIEMAQKRIPDEYSGLSFFSINDTWVYHAVFDDKFCVLCQAKAVPFTYSGLHLRRDFPYLEIETVNRIKARVHMPRDDNCRCWLERSISIEIRGRPTDEYAPITIQAGFEDKLKNPEKAIAIYNKVLQGVPAKDTADLDYVEIHDFPEKKYTVTRGRFSRDPETKDRTIKVDPVAAGESTSKMKRVMTHEIGHNVWYNLKAEDWAEWFQVYRFHNESLPTDYAKSNVREAWAECYRLYRAGRLAPGKRYKRPYAKAYRQDMYNRFDAIMKRYAADDTYPPKDTVKERAKKAQELLDAGYGRISWSDIDVPKREW